MNAVAIEVAEPVLRLDLGCGPNPKEGFHGVDSIKFDKVGTVLNIGIDKWPWPDSSVSEAYCAHTLEHLTNFNDKWERVHFFNELYRVLKHDASCTLVIPHWSSNRYYGDPTHKEPFSEFGFYYLDKNWRAVNAPHADIAHNPKGYSCHLACTWGYALHPSLAVRNAEYQQHAQQFWIEARQDMHANVKAVKV